MLSVPKLRLVTTNEKGEEQDITPSLSIGNLEVRLATTAAEVDAVQALRYSVNYEEGGAVPTTDMLARKRDYDNLDQHCDHLLVVDTAKTEILDAVVGTYRLIRKPHAKANGSWYSAGEYDVSMLLNNEDELLEVGRSCVRKEYRTKHTMMLMWRAIAVYAAQHKLKTIFGCASITGVDPEEHALALSYLYHHHLAPPAVRLTALPDRYVNMQILPESEIDVRAAIAALPPLIKGYMNLGGFVGDGAVIDYQWGSTDVAIIVQTDRLTGRYADHYKRHTGDYLGKDD